MDTRVEAILQRNGLHGLAEQFEASVSVRVLYAIMQDAFDAGKGENSAEVFREAAEMARKFRNDEAKVHFHEHTWEIVCGRIANGLETKAKEARDD